ncbi:uncharacterized protein LOC121424718 [Lytechinus variegatus]|uniref:uncharacterized protein LOC121424718 n=1 Tax=Lytechinus variegatus TaxID=7654 RepID=UPI001BB201CF|nr:uncharacterized protein LOC121424718 [Lytechinus variegatus]
MSAMYRFECIASLQKIPMRLVALNVLLIAAGAYADSCLRSEEQNCCSDGHGLNYTLPMFTPCQTIMDGGLAVQTIPKLIQVPHVTQCRRKKELGIPFGNRICRLPDCKNGPCTQGWCEETMTGYRCHPIADNEDVNTTPLTTSITTIASTASPTTNNTATTPTTTSNITDETTTGPLPTTTRASATTFTSPSSTRHTTTPPQQICQSNPCLNGGTCKTILVTNLQQAFECECSRDFYGQLCECSTLFTPDVDTSRTYTFPNLWIRGNVTSFDFMVSADNDAHIGLFPSNTTDEKYELAIGGWVNTGGQIVRGSHPASWDILYPHTSNVSLSQIPEFDHYQLSFANGHIQLSHYDNGTVVMEAQDSQQPLQVSYIGIWTGFGSVGYWRFPTFCPSGIPAMTRSRQISQSYMQISDSVIQGN